MNDEDLSYYLRELRAKSEDAFSALRSHIESSDIPKLIAAFYAEPVIAVKADLLEIIWQQRMPDTLSFLATVLQHPNSKLWLVALDGIVAIDTPLAMTILETEKSRLLSSQLHDATARLEYIIEAIQQLSEV
jgi:hypothetical protein